jgi:hypothetical protein
VPHGLTIGWPTYLHRGTHFWADQIFSGLRSNGARIALRDIPQQSGFSLFIEIDDGQGSQTVAFDNRDSPQIDEEIAECALLYFKLQYAQGGYRRANVVPGGYVLASNAAYRYLPLLRAIRSAKRFRYDVYGRFGLRYGGAELRRRAHELLVAREDFRYEGSLFKYPGGPDKVPYRQYLFEIARAKVCVDLPGNGDFCTRLIDYLAVGACVVGPPPSVRLPVPPVDGVHLVHCAPDLSDLGDICAQLVQDDDERERIARNGRLYFDRHLHRRRLGGYYLQQIDAARSRDVVPAPKRRRVFARRAVRALAGAMLVGLLLVDILVVLPEKFGDRPYNALGRDSRHSVTHAHTHPENSLPLGGQRESRFAAGVPRKAEA